MSVMRVMKARPWLTVGVAGALAALVLGVVPISYQRVAGRDVTLSLSGPGLGADRVREVARELKSLLRVDHVAVRATSRDGRQSFDLSALVPRGSSVDAAGAARVFAGELTKLGYTASAATAIRKERVSGTVYAYARDQVIEINMDGKSAAQLETEIRQRLAEAGVTDAKVEVTDLGGNQRGVKLQVEAHHSDASAPGGEALPELVLKRDGAPVTGHGFTVRMEKRKTDSGTTLAVTVHQGDKEATARVANPESMTDAALGAEIASQLEQAGLDVIVSVTDGGVEVRSRQDP